MWIVMLSEIFGWCWVVLGASLLIFTTPSSESVHQGFVRGVISLMMIGVGFGLIALSKSNPEPVVKKPFKVELYRDGVFPGLYLKNDRMVKER